MVTVADVRMAEKVFILLEEAQRTGWQCNLEAVWLALIVSQTQASWPSYVVLLYSIQPKGEERPLWWKGYRLTLIGGELDHMYSILRSSCHPSIKRWKGSWYQGSEGEMLDFFFQLLGLTTA